MEAHFQKCRASTDDESESYTDMNMKIIECDQGTDVCDSRRTSICSDVSSSGAGTSNKSLLSLPSTSKGACGSDTSVKKFVVLTKADQLSRFVYATNTPFTHVEHPEFLKLVEMLHPGYKPPNKKQVGGNLLEEVYSSTHCEMN